MEKKKEKGKKKLWLILVAAAVLEIPFQLWILPMFRSTTADFENDYITFTYPKEYSSKKTSKDFYSFMDTDTGNFFHLSYRTLWSRDTLESCTEFQIEMNTLGGFSAHKETEDITADNEPAKFVQYGSPYSYSAEVIVLHGGKRYLLFFYLQFNQGNEQMIKDIVASIEFK